MSEPSEHQTPRATRSGRRSRPRWRLLVPVVTAAAGLMFAMSFRAAGGSDLRSDRDLPSLILERDDAVAAQAARLDRLQQEVDALSRASAPTDTRLQALTRAGDSVAPEAAMTPVAGPSITVSLDDSSVPLDSLPPEFSPDDVVVHQQDVQGVVNALWASGAEAMMIQDQRVISTSAVRCVGNTLILQGRVYSPPYVIKAIGDVEAMHAGLDADPQVDIYKQYVQAVGLGYSVATEAATTFPAYAGSLDLTHATVATAGRPDSSVSK